MPIFSRRPSKPAPQERPELDRLFRLMRFLLDSNAVIALLNDPAGHVSRRVRQYQPADIGLSAIVMHELYFGAFKSRRRDRNLAIVDGLRIDEQVLENRLGIRPPH